MFNVRFATGYLCRDFYNSALLPLFNRKAAATIAKASLEGARVFQSPTRYVQLPGLIKQLGKVVQGTFPNLKRAGIVLSKRSAKDTTGISLIKSFENPVVYEFDSQCSKAGVQLLQTEFENEGVDHVIR